LIWAQAYKNYASMIINRVNTITGVKYKDDPTIFAWELANEPHTTDNWDTLHGKPAASTVRNWVGEMAAFIKGQDPNHMVRAPCPCLLPALFLCI